MSKTCKNTDCEYPVIGRSLYCSEYCKNNYHNFTAKAKKVKKPVPCPVCKTMFIRGRGRYGGCSKSCNRQLMAKVAASKPKPHHIKFDATKLVIPREYLVRGEISMRGNTYGD